MKNQTYRKFECRSAGTAADTVEDNDIDIVQKSINSLLPHLKLSRTDTSTAISGLRVAKMEKYLDIDVIELAKRESIPAIFFHLVIGEFDGARLSAKSSKFLQRAKALLNDLDGNIYAGADVGTKVSKIKNTKKMLFAAADRALKRKELSVSLDGDSYSSTAKPDWKVLQRADKELKVRLRIESFIKNVNKFFSEGKFLAKGTSIVYQLPEGSVLFVPKSMQLSSLEREYGMIRSVEDGKLSWMMVPSIQYFASHSNSNKYGKLSPLISVILKLDPKAVITKVGKLLKVVSAKLKSSRLDDAFEMLGKKCGAVWKGRSSNNSDILIWQTLHSLEMYAKSKR